MTKKHFLALGIPIRPYFALQGGRQFLHVSSSARQSSGLVYVKVLITDLLRIYWDGGRGNGIRRYAESEEEHSQSCEAGFLADCRLLHLGCHCPRYGHAKR